MTELLCILREKRMESTLNEILMEREEYLQCRESEQKLWKELMSTELTNVQFQVLDRFLSARNQTDLCYGEVAYELGMRDGINLVKAVDELVVKEF